MYNSTGNTTSTGQRFLSTLPWFLIILSISTAIFNLAVLGVFIRVPALRTPFNVYLVFLSVENVGQAVLDLPFNVLVSFVPVWPLGRVACNFNLYCKWVFTGLVRNTHSLISLNRIWALFFPIHYRDHHNGKVAVLLCGGLVAYVHMFLLPGLVQDWKYYRHDDGSCYVNTTANRYWALPTQLVLYDSTLVVIVVTYPLIWWRIRQRKKSVWSGNGRARTNTRTGTSTVAAWRKETSNHGQPDETDRVPAQVDQDPQHQASVVPQSATKTSHSFAVLTYLVIGVTVCWSPIMVYYTLQGCCDAELSNEYFVVASLLYYLNSLLDPFFYALAIRPLRNTIFDMLRLKFFRSKITSCT